MAGGSDGTVRGTFDLDTRPAIRAVEDYKREAARADEQTRRLGSSIDESFGRSKSSQINTVRDSMGELGTTSTEVRRSVRDDWQGMRRDIEKEAAQIVTTIDVVRERMRALGRERPSIQVDVDGVDRALAKVELLHERINALGRERATPRVAIGGGGMGSAATRAAAGAASGGGGGGILSAGGVGFAGLPGGALAAAAGAALPVVQALGGATVALAGSLTGAGLGAAGAGLAGGGALAAGIGGVMSVAKPATNALKESVKAQQAYTKAVQDHGRLSKEARQAQVELDRTFRGQPGLRYATQQMRAFSREWASLTAPGRRQFFGGIGDVTRIGRRAAPNMAANANLATGAVRGAAVNQATMLSGTTVQDTLSFFTRSFARELPTAERTLENVELTFLRLARSANPFFHDANVWVRNWTFGWRESTRDIAGTRAKMEPLIQSFKDWRDLSGSVFHTVRDLFEMGAPAGDSMVVDLTHTFDRWDSWIQANPDKTRQFFRDTVSSTEKLAGGLAGVVHWLNDMASLLRPILDRFSQLVQLTSSLGLVGAPGAVTGLIGAFRGARGGGGAIVGGGRGVGGRGGGGGIGGGLAIGAAAAGVGGIGRATALQARSGIAGSGALMMGAATVGPAAVLARRETAAAARLRASAGLRGRLSSGLSRVGGLAGVGRAGGALGGAVRGAAPIAGLFAAADFASTQGTFDERAQAAANSLTFGLIPTATTGAQARIQGQQRAAQNIGDLGQAGSVGDVRAQIARLQAAQARAVAGSRTHQGHGLFGGVGFAGLFQSGRGGDSGPTATQARASAAAAGTYGKQIESLVKQERALLGARNARLDAVSRQRATQYGAGLSSAYQAYRGGGQSQGQAAESTVKQIQGRLAGLRGSGAEVLGEAALEWANTLKRHNPKIQKQVDELTDSIRKRFKRLGEDVTLVNGNILTGSKSEWSNIRDAMAGPMEEARQKLAADFTSIQQQAVGSLRAMGFSKSEASALVKGAETQQGKRNLSAATSLIGGNAGEKQAAKNIPGAVALGNKKATGGTIPGAGLSDSVNAGGAMVAPGETWIANRHTMAELTRATVAKFGKTAQQMITGESRRHSAPPAAKQGILPGLARGGVMAGGGDALAAMMSTAQRIDAAHYPYKWGGGHDNGFTAPYDCSGAVSAVLHSGGLLNAPLTSGSLMSWGAAGPGAVSIYASPAHTYMNLGGEWFGTSTQNPGGGAGFFKGSARPGFVVRHVAGLGGGGSGAALAGMAGFGGAGGTVQVNGLGVQQRGLAGVLRGRAGDIYAAGLSQRLNAAIGGAGVAATGGGGSARALGRSMMTAQGWPASEWPSLDQLWTRESGWNANARNKSSGAAGIPQDITGNMHGGAGGQIAWGLNYIRGRYGSPSAAWAHEQQSGWYARGGRVKWAGAFARGGSFLTNGPTMFMAGEGGGGRQREHVNVTPVGKGGGGAGRVNVTFAAGAVVVKSGSEAGEEIVKKIIDAIDKGTSGVVD